MNRTITGLGLGLAACFLALEPALPGPALLILPQRLPSSEPLPQREDDGGEVETPRVACGLSGQQHIHISFLLLMQWPLLHARNNVIYPHKRSAVEQRFFRIVV